MERLTDKKDNGEYAITVHKKTLNALDVSYTIKRVIDKLAAYEDTMPLERVRELAQADKDGRLAALPCKAGDTVYAIISHVNIDELV